MIHVEITQAHCCAFHRKNGYFCVGCGTVDYTDKHYFYRTERGCSSCDASEKLQFVCDRCVLGPDPRYGRFIGGKRLTS